MGKVITDRDNSEWVITDWGGAWWARSSLIEITLNGSSLIGVRLGGQDHH